MVWIISAFFLIYQTFSIYPPCPTETPACSSGQSMQWSNTFSSLSKLIAQFLTIHITSLTLFQVRQVSTTTQRITTVLLFIFFFGLGFGRVLDSILQLIQSYQPTLQDQANSIYYLFTPGSPLMNWYGASAYTTPFMFIWDCIPMTVAFYLMVQSKQNLSIVKAIREMMKLDSKRRFRIAIYGQVLVIVTYYLLTYFRFFTAVMGNDRVYLAMDGLVLFLLSGHTLLNFILVFTVRDLLSVKLKKAKAAKKVKEQEVKEQVVKVPSTKRPALQNLNDLFSLFSSPNARPSPRISESSNRPTRSRAATGNVEQRPSESANRPSRSRAPT